MASFGAKYPMFAPIKTEPETGMPTYDTPVAIGRLIKADMSISMASGKLYGDDALAESADEFSSATIAMETDDMTDDVAGVVYGAKVTDKLVTYSAEDQAPMGGLSYLKYMMRNGVKSYKAIFYPKVKPIIGNDNAQTKGDSITFGTNSTNFTVYETNDGIWRQTEEFADLASARAWQREKFGDTTGA